MNHLDMKTIVVLDRNGKFAEKCHDTFELITGDGARQRRWPMEKSFWTWCLEGVFEMHRILSDVYPTESPPLRFAVAENPPRMLENEWKDELPTTEELQNLMFSVKLPAYKHTEISLIGGLAVAIEALATETQKQKDENYDRKYSEPKPTVVNPNPPDRAINNANLIVYTRLRTEEEVERLKIEVGNLLRTRNNIANGPNGVRYCAITSLRLFIVNFYATGERCFIKTHPLKPHPLIPILKTWVISRKAADMPDAIHSVLFSAFDLGSTTVTKIPMKTSDASISYDVELFHSAKVHALLKETKLIDEHSKNAHSEDGVTYDTIRLGWLTAPKTKWTLFPNYGEAVPFTTVLAYSAPLACLTQFVLSGKFVMLDLEKTFGHEHNMPDKLVSHLLSSNKGRVFIQEVDFTKGVKNIRRKLRHPKKLRRPKVPVNKSQFNSLFQQMELAMVAKDRLTDELSAEEQKERCMLEHSNLERRFQRISRNIPMFEKDTFIFKDLIRKQLENLIVTFTKVKITDEEFGQCKAEIRKLQQLKINGDFLIPADSDIGPCSVKDLSDPTEQLKVTVVELATHMIRYKKFSDAHEKLYNSFAMALQVDKLMSGSSGQKDILNFPVLGKLGKRKIQEGESPLSEFLRKRKIDTSVEMGGDEPKNSEDEERVIEAPQEIKFSLFEMMCKKAEKQENKIRREFVGREKYGNKAKLYTQLLDRPIIDRGDRSSSPAPSNDRTDRFRRMERGESGTPPPIRKLYK
ncbi:unnamed protein product [Caenorhabditis sp. 36 PRJEB53466]|nr:unnamed protein product [Caenorhabditis sp. 36 PRJEB53466]